MAAPHTPVSDPSLTFVRHLPVIDRVVAILGRRNSLSITDVEEFGAWARARIIDADYAVLRKFTGRASLSTYLSVVVTNLFHDWRNAQWGRWRPSAAATRLGPVAMRLEQLLYRDGYSIREAIELFRTSGIDVPDSDLRRIAASIPVRASNAETSLEAATQTPADVDEGMQRTVADAPLRDALRDALDELPAEDRVIVRMWFWEGESIADIARLLRLDQKKLYRRLESIEALLRSHLARRGIDRERALDYLKDDPLW